MAAPADQGGAVSTAQIEQSRDANAAVHVSPVRQQRSIQGSLARLQIIYGELQRAKSQIIGSLLRIMPQRCMPRGST